MSLLLLYNLWHLSTRSAQQFNFKVTLVRFVAKLLFIMKSLYLSVFYYINMNFLVRPYSVITTDYIEHVLYEILLFNKCLDGF